MDSESFDKIMADIEASMKEESARPFDVTMAIMELNSALQQQDSDVCCSILEELRPNFSYIKGHEFATFHSHAIAAGDRAKEFLDILLDAGVPAHCVYDWIGSEYQRTPVIAAARAGRRDLIERLVAAGADLNWCSPTGANALSEILPSRACQASRADSEELAYLRQWLTEKGLSIDATCADSCRKMFWASGQPQSWPDIPDLLAYGISLQSTRWTAFQYDLAMGQAKAVDVANLNDEELHHRDAWSRTPFLLAITAGDRDLAQALLNRGSDPHAKGHCGASALHIAAKQNHSILIPWLLELGISISVKNNFDESPLHEAVGHHSFDSAVVLLENGADVHGKTETCDAVIHRVPYHGDLRMLRMLLDHGADINDISRPGEWPLKEACREGHLAAVEFLLENGADPHLTSTGDTALFAAVIADSIDCIQRLIDAGADVNVTDCDGWTCLFCLRSQKAARLLLDHGASPAVGDEIGELPEDLRGIPRGVRKMLKEARLNGISCSS